MNRAGPPIFAESTITQVGRAYEPFNVAVPIIEIALVWPARPWLMNADNTMHYRERAANRKAWRDAFRRLSYGSPRLAWCDIEVVHETPTRRSTDYAAAAPAAKAAVDGCRDFKNERTGEPYRRILEDDSPAFVASCKFWTPVFTGRDALTIILRGPQATPLTSDH